MESISTDPPPLPNQNQPDHDQQPNKNVQFIPTPEQEPETELDIQSRDNDSSFSGLLWPPVTFCLVFVQVMLYYSKGYLGITEEEQVYVSRETVFKKHQYWRLLYAHFFNFHKGPLYVHAVALFNTGRYVEKKVRPIPLLIVIELMGISSNLMYIMFSSLLCSGSHSDHTYGFNMVLFGLRVIQMYAKQFTGGRKEPDMLFGLIPAFVPNWSRPFLPLVEVVLFDVFVHDRCFAGNVAGFLCGGIFPYIVYLFSSRVLLDPVPVRPLDRDRDPNCKRKSDQKLNRTSSAAPMPNLEDYLDSPDSYDPPDPDNNDNIDDGEESDGDGGSIVSMESSDMDLAEDRDDDEDDVINGNVLPVEIIPFPNPADDLDVDIEEDHDDDFDLDVDDTLEDNED